jgi:hypothetical protein
MREGHFGKELGRKKMLAKMNEHLGGMGWKSVIFQWFRLLGGWIDEASFLGQ